MACNCTKCNPNNCGCNDSALTNPCTYTDCSVGSERCEDVQCSECVSYCGTSFQIGSTDEKIKIETGERLDSIIQKFALMLSQGVGTCTADDVDHAPYNLYATSITSTTVTIVWNGVSTLSAGTDVYYDSGSGAVLAASSIQAGTQTYTITNLNTNTPYTIYLQSGSCRSVEILITTLL